MGELDKRQTYEKAYDDYIAGMKYKDIASKYDVSENTVKSWRKRYGWTRNCTPKKECNKTKVQSKINKLREDIKADLVLQFKARDLNCITFLDLIDDYMEFWDIKNRLIQDIKTRGVNIKWHNGKQEGLKKNDSTGDLVKINNQMLKILDQLNLEAPPQTKEDEDDDI